MARGTVRFVHWLALAPALLAASTGARASESIPPWETSALNDLYDQTGGEGWVHQEGWRVGERKTVDVCERYGVSCEDGHVVRLELEKNNLTGRLPLAFLVLRHLRRLHLGWNRLEGSIPARLGDLGALKELALPGNRLSGAIPPTIGRLHALTLLDLSSNRLVARLPVTVGGLRNLRWLNLSRNRLAGPLPEGLRRLRELEGLELGSNELEGTVSGDWTAPNLKSLDLSNNRFAGLLPPRLRGLPQLGSLRLSGNRLAGRIPRSWAALKELKSLELAHNRLSGPIPAFLLTLENLFYLDLSENRLGGRLPTGFDTLRKLQALNLSNNQIIGSIPDTVGGAIWLHRLDLSHNRLEGRLPARIGELHQLSVLHLADNQLSGSLPSSIGDLADLRELNLADNHLEGKIPDEMGELDQLVRLDLSRNRLSGPLPETLKGLASLRELRMADNRLTGALPDWIIELTGLVWLDVSHNAHEGVLPAGLAKLTELQVLRLGGNHFSGRLSAELGELQHLRWLDVGGNAFQGSVPDQLQSLPLLEALDLGGHPGEPQNAPWLRRLPRQPGSGFRAFFVEPAVRERALAKAEPLSQPPPTPTPWPTPSPSVVPSPQPTSLPSTEMQIAGNVLDETGSPLPGASVTLTSPSLSVSTTTTMDGSFRIVRLDPGRYRLTVTMAGFANVGTDVELLEGTSQTVTLTLPVGRLVETVEVMAESLAPSAMPTWNSWVSPRSSPDPGSAVARLQAGRSYRFHLDLSAYDYGYPQVQRDSLDRHLLDEITKAFYEARVSHLRVRVLPILVGRAVRFGDGRSRPLFPASAWSNGAWELTEQRMFPMQISLPALLPPSDTADPAVHAPDGAHLVDDGRAAGLAFDLVAVEEGCAAVTVSIWDEDLRRPLDEIVHPLTVGASATCGERMARKPLSGGFVRRVLDRRDPGADAALNVFEFALGGQERTVAVYTRPPRGAEDVGCPDSYHWEPPEPPSRFLSEGDLFPQILLQAWSDETGAKYGVLAERLRAVVFGRPGKDPCGGGAALKDLKGLAAQPGRSLLFRLGRGDEVLAFPLGLLFGLRAGTAAEPTPAFAYPVEVVQPLPLENDREPGDCISDWSFVLPPTLDGAEPGDLVLPAEVAGDRGLIRDRAGLRDYFDTEDAGRSQGLVLLAHHLGGEIYFDKPGDGLYWADFDREFSSGSVAVIAACSVGKLNSPRHLLKWLNDRGVDAMVFSPFDVPTDFGTRMALNFARTTVAHREKGDTTSLLQLWREATTATVEALGSTLGVRAQGMVSEFILAGDSSLRLCKPD